MTLVRVIPPAVLPLSLGELKAQARLTDFNVADEDALLVGYLRSAIEMLEGPGGHLGMALITQTWDYKLGCFPRGGKIVLPLPPLQSVTSIVYLDGDGAEQTLDTSAYVVAGIGNARARPAIYLLPNQSWPTTRDQPEAVAIRFVVGFGDTHNDVPESIRLLLMQMVVELHCDREGEMGMAPGIERLIRRHRVDLSLA